MSMEFMWIFLDVFADFEIGDLDFFYGSKGYNKYVENLDGCWRFSYKAYSL